MTRPILPPKSIIEYADIQAEVVKDYGGATLEVIADGVRQDFYWHLDGETCRVIWTPDMDKDREALPVGAIIEYLGMEGIVVKDEGGPLVTVLTEGEESVWKWTFEGTSCVVKTLAQKAV